MAKKNDYKNKSEKDLLKQLQEKQLALRAFRFGIAGSKVKNMKEGKALRRDMARILTALNAQKG
jgi:ribosomal protein L29